MPVPALPAHERQRLVARFKALGDDIRLGVFRLVAGKDAPIRVCDIVDRFPVSQPTMSHRCRVLRDVDPPILALAPRARLATVRAVGPAGKTARR
jgi:hypothetical protein